jgi:hypothetical protein
MVFIVSRKLSGQPTASRPRPHPLIAKPPFQRCLGKEPGGARRILLATNNRDAGERPKEAECVRDALSTVD